MNTPIALIDYGAGNLTSVRKGFAAAGAELVTPRRAADLDGARAIVVPGVGHFRATAPLAVEWRGAILQAVDRGVPLFGICLGLQWLFESSDEAADVPGLGLMRGRCERLPPTVKVPHVGWNSLAMTRSSRLLAGVPDGCAGLLHPLLRRAGDGRLRRRRQRTAARSPRRSSAATSSASSSIRRSRATAGLQVIRNFLAVL